MIDNNVENKYLKRAWIWFYTRITDTVNKAILQCFLSIVIPIYTNILFPDILNKEYISLPLISGYVFLCIIQIVLICVNTKEDANSKKVIKLFDSTNKAYSEIIQAFTKICTESANGANTVIHSIITSRTANIAAWNFDNECNELCEKIYQTLVNIFPEQNPNFEIVYDKLIEDGKDNKVKAIAYHNKNKTAPSICGKIRYCKGSNRSKGIIQQNYFDCTLFEKNKADIVILENKQEIIDAFCFLDAKENIRDKIAESDCKYNQYVGIPVMCNNYKMIGMIQIVCLNETSLGEDKEAITRILNSYICVYRDLSLLLHKLEKGLLAKPKVSSTPTRNINLNNRWNKR